MIEGAKPNTLTADQVAQIESVQRKEAVSADMTSTTQRETTNTFAGYQDNDDVTSLKSLGHEIISKNEVPSNIGGQNANKDKPQFGGISVAKS